ncbi:MAG: asparaginase [Oligoflexales bacterium]|nr:asparaginase [Oligoflexales bacterium]
MGKDLNAKFRVTVITTGGTIDKVYDEVAGSLENKGTVMREKIFAKLRLPYTSLEVYPIMSKDSLYMTDQDRKYISQTIASFAAKTYPILVIHGTDTMTQTARLCAKDQPNISVPVIFTGAMKPQGYENTDALQNVSEALLAARFLKPGFYISFHNRIFEARNSRKNKELMTFEAYDPSQERGDPSS